MTTASHTPVLLERVSQLLAPVLAQAGAVAVDATLGAGGHSQTLLAAHPQLHLVGIDRDPAALRLAEQRLSGFGQRFHPVHDTYDHIPAALARCGFAAADGILFDLGVSSMQLDEDARGFAYSRDAALDMRMDPTTGPTAAEILNTYSPERLEYVLRHFGDERYARNIVRAVVRARQAQPFTTSGPLVDLIRGALPARAMRTGGNPAKRTFQALRIEVNQELDVLGNALPAAFEALRVGGRLVVLSYHSGEDRLVKAAFRDLSTSAAPPDLPVIPQDLAPRARVLTRGSEKASEDELLQNPRSASVRLRAVSRIR